MSRCRRKYICLPGARDFAVERPEFALAAGMTGLRGIANGWGYDITGIDLLDAYAAVMAAGAIAGVDEAVVNADVRELIAGSGTGGEFVLRILAASRPPAQNTYETLPSLRVTAPVDCNF